MRDEITAAKEKFVAGLKGTTAAVEELKAKANLPPHYPHSSPHTHFPSVP